MVIAAKFSRLLQGNQDLEFTLTKCYAQSQGWGILKTKCAPSFTFKVHCKTYKMKKVATNNFSMNYLDYVCFQCINLVLENKTKLINQSKIIEIKLYCWMYVFRMKSVYIQKMHVFSQTKLNLVIRVKENLTDGHTLVKF